jgi:hypothetical protein
VIVIVHGNDDTEEAADLGHLQPPPTTVLSQARTFSVAL